MAKLTLTDITSGYQAAATTNANNDAIEAAVENTLSRDGTSPNTMGASLDMNSNTIINLPAATTDTEPLTLGQASGYANISDTMTGSITFNDGVKIYFGTGDDTSINFDGTDWLFSGKLNLDGVTTATAGDASVYINSTSPGIELYDSNGTTNARRLRIAGTSAGSYFISAHDDSGSIQNNIEIFNSATGSSQQITIDSYNVTFDCTKMGFFSANPQTKPAVSGSAGGNAALQSLLTALDTLGLITDSSS